MKGGKLVLLATGLLVGFLLWPLVFRAIPVYRAQGYAEGWRDADREAQSRERWDRIYHQIERNTRGCLSTDAEILAAGFAAGVSQDVVSYRIAHHCPGVRTFREHIVPEELPDPLRSPPGVRDDSGGFLIYQERDANGVTLRLRANGKLYTARGENVLDAKGRLLCLLDPDRQGCK